jgi:Trypsin-like peptidase domain/Tetratricopeptide repeat
MATALTGINIGWLPMMMLAAEEQPQLPAHLSRLYQRKPYTPEDLADYATMFTVEILAKNSKKAGSGILLEKQGDVYTVLTAGHVLNAETSFTIKTADGKVYRAVASSVKLAKHGVDLGLLKFQSSNKYELVGIGSSNSLSIGSSVYVAGYPGESSVIASGKFNCTKGEIITKNDGNSKGYSLVYSNITRPGMSGGPVLNEYGRLVAIHGQGEREENTAKTGRNLGISIERFGLVALDMGVSKNLPIPTLSRSTSYRASEYFLQAQERLDRRDSVEALKFYNQAIEIDPKFIDAYLGRAEVKGFWLRNIQGEIDDYSKIITINPKFADAYYRRGLRRKDLNNNAAAIQDFRQAAKLYRAQGNIKDLKITLKELRELGYSEN